MQNGTEVGQGASGASVQVPCAACRAAGASDNEFRAGCPTCATSAGQLAALCEYCVAAIEMSTRGPSEGLVIAMALLEGFARLVGLSRAGVLQLFAAQWGVSVESVADVVVERPGVRVDRVRLTDVQRATLLRCLDDEIEASDPDALLGYEWGVIRPTSEEQQKAATEMQATRARLVLLRALLANADAVEVVQTGAV